MNILSYMYDLLRKKKMPAILKYLEEVEELFYLKKLKNYMITELQEFIIQMMVEKWDYKE